VAGQAAEYLKRRSVRRLEELTQPHLDACHRLFSKKFPAEAGAILVLARFLHEIGHAETPPVVLRPSQTETHVNAFMTHLDKVRGYVPSTIRRQGQIATEFLAWLKFEAEPDRLAAVTPNDLEGFIRYLSKRMGRVGLQKPIAIMRNFLRFLATDGTVPVGLDAFGFQPPTKVNG
jgi:hypothetical protein